VEADASEYAMGAVLSQKNEAGTLHLCAFFSCKFVSAEQNYEIYGKEIWVIVEALENWRHYLEGSRNKTIVYSDHKNLLWFAETKLYNRHQARWAEKLSRFDFIIIFRPGKDQGKPDALSRRPDYWPPKGGGRENKNNEFLFLKRHQVDLSHLESPTLSSKAHLVALKGNAIDSIATDDELAKAIKTVLLDDQDIGQHLGSLHNPDLPHQENAKALLEPLTVHDDLVLRNRLVYVLDENSIMPRIPKSCYDSLPASHLGEAKTLELVTYDYYWPCMWQYVEDYIKLCNTCARNKAS
jgi:hypothetical protein